MYEKISLNVILRACYFKKLLQSGGGFPFPDSPVTVRFSHQTPLSSMYILNIKYDVACQNQGFVAEISC